MLANNPSRIKISKLKLAYVQSNLAKGPIADIFSP